MLISFLKKSIRYLKAKLTPGDKFPPIHYKSPFTALTNFFPYSWLRIHLWSMIAKQYKPFRPFYGGEISEQTNDGRIAELYKKGYFVIENFLEKQSHEKLCEEINSIVEQRLNEMETFNMNKDGNLIHFNVNLDPEKASKELIPPLSFFTHHFFGSNKTLHPDQFGLDIYISKDGIDDEGGSAPACNWHRDRFVPVVKAIYFPFGCDWSPFGRELGSPLITKEYKKNMINVACSGTNSEPDPPNSYESIVEPNTMLFGAHHMLHRRTPISTPGKRVAIFLNWYNAFDKYKLIRRSVSSLFKN
tara:strand:+ start:363 stop:1268 length:906 start_codon:yes stop_codon:yes gene_type:complete